jgi:Fe-Mn family superoxide dismutase
MGGRGGEPSGELAAAIARDFGSLQAFREQFERASNTLFGSGWAFVTVTQDGRLAIVQKPNQDSPLMDGTRVLMGNDVWEHAYYLRYQNRRAEYVRNWWGVLDWERIGARYAAAKAGTLGV